MRVFGAPLEAMVSLRGQVTLPWSLLLIIAATLSFTGCVSVEGDAEELAFTGAGGTRLQATLLTPRETGDSQLPAIVLLHGAEKATRKRLVYKLTANVFLERGIAVLVYDKRGAGESEGDHDTSTYAQLVEDAISAVRFLRQHPRVDGDRVGILGISESGWLTPEIAERSGKIAFVINKVGSPLSVRDTVAWEVYNEMLDDGVAENSARKQTDIYRRIWEYRIAPTTDERSAIEDTLAKWNRKPDSQLPAELREVSNSYVADISYDPTPYLERLDVPMLYLYGRHDVNIPTRESVQRLAVLAAQGKPITSFVFENEGHELGGFTPLPPLYKFTDGYATLIGDFAEQHVKN